MRHSRANRASDANAFIQNTEHTANVAQNSKMKTQTISVARAVARFHNV